MKRVPCALAAALMLIGCGGDSAAENEAEALERAQEQDSPEAADVLRNAAGGGAGGNEAGNGH